MAGRPKSPDAKTKAELQKDFRERMQNKGYRHAAFWLHKELISKVKKLAVANEVTLWEQYNSLIEKGIKQEIKELR